MIKEYCKKPVVIKAIQWTGLNIHEIDEGFPELRRLPLPVGNVGMFVIETLEGKMVASIGDYIIEDIAGEYYPCKPEIFKETYEVA